MRVLRFYLNSEVVLLFVCLILTKIKFDGVLVLEETLLLGFGRMYQA